MVPESQLTSISSVGVDAPRPGSIPGTLPNLAAMLADGRSIGPRGKAPPSAVERVEIAITL
jgi:hypothetical protein